MAATKSLGFGIPTGLSIDPSLNRRGGVKVCVVRCSVSPFTSAGTASSVMEKPWSTYNARLVLEDGSIWSAKSFDDEESRQCFLAGLVIRIITSNWRCTKTLGDYLAERNIMGIYDLDTRAITRRLRENGSLNGLLSTEGSKTDEELLQMSRSWDIRGLDLISDFSCKSPYQWFDKTKPDWYFNTTSHPVRNNTTGRVEISAQSHNYAVDPATLPGGVEVTHVNLNDGSCAGLSYPSMNVMSLQYHPEASPGTHDSDNAFGDFVELMKRSKR